MIAGELFHGRGKQAKKVTEVTYVPDGRIATQWKGGENGQFNTLVSIAIVVYRFGVFHYWLWHVCTHAHKTHDPS